MSSFVLVVLAALACIVSIAGECLPPIVVNVSSYAQITQLADTNLTLTHGNGSNAMMMVTLTDNATAANETLYEPACRVPSLILETGQPWPGNLYKILAFRAVSLALPANTVIFFTDCCDVLFLPSPLGGAAGVFDAFEKIVAANSTSRLAGAEVVMGVERGYSMIIDEALDDRIKEHDHSPNDFPANTMEADAGVGDFCQDSLKLCWQSKFPNSGTVIGYARSLANMYDGACNENKRCKEWEREHGNVSLNLTSDQNVLTHYLLETNFSSHRIALDTDMALFHVTSGFVADDYSFEDGQLKVLVPGSRQTVTLDASVVHVPNVKYSPASAVMSHISDTSDVSDTTNISDTSNTSATSNMSVASNISVMSKLQELVALSQSSTSLKRKRRFLAGGRKKAVMKEGRHGLQSHKRLMLKVDDHTKL